MGGGNQDIEHCFDGRWQGFVCLSKDRDQIIGSWDFETSPSLIRSYLGAIIRGWSAAQETCFKGGRGQHRREGGRAEAARRRRGHFFYDPIPSLFPLRASFGHSGPPPVLLSRHRHAAATASTPFYVSCCLSNGLYGHIPCSQTD